MPAVTCCNFDEIHIVLIVIKLTFVITTVTPSRSINYHEIKEFLSISHLLDLGELIFSYYMSSSLDWNFDTFARPRPGRVGLACKLAAAAELAPPAVDSLESPRADEI